MRRNIFEAEMVCLDCGYTYTAEFHVDSDSGVVSILHGCDENCAECGSANVEQVD